MRFTPYPDALALIESYPPDARDALVRLRDLIVETAEESEDVDALEEALKWGEPAYLTTHGSTVRIDWKEADPDHVAVYFNCNTPLIETFEKLYGDVFEFEGKRAILLTIGADIPEAQLKHCVSIALTYHKRKRLAMLGA